MSHRYGGWRRRAPQQPGETARPPAIADPAAPMPAEWRPRLRALIPLYAAAWVAVICAMLGMGSVVEDNAFTTATITLVTVGFAISLLLRIAGIRRSATPVLLTCVGLSLAILLRLHQYGLAMPGAGSVVISVMPALLLSWFLVVYSFCLIADDLLLFVIPPSLAVLGLSGTENPNADMTAYFLVFMVAVIFTVSYQNHLRYLPAEQAGQSPRKLRRVLTWQLVMTAALFTAVAVVTAVVAVPLRDSGSVGLNRFRVSAGSLLQAFENMGYATMGREIQMGAGSASLSDRVLFRVRAAGSMPWRARTYDQYTGRGWADNSSGVPLVVASIPDGRWQVALLPEGALGPKERQLRVPVAQRFTVAAGWSGRALVAAAEPAIVRFDSDPGYVQLSYTGAVRFLSMPYLPAGMTYEVSSQVLAAPPKLLRSADSPDPDDPLLQVYLSLPTSVAALRPEVERLVKGLGNNYDRASAIEDWLSATYTYNLEAPPLPQDQDLVMHFLHTSREGWCEQFASAMVVMCRLAHIPARLATGFAPMEERDPDTGDLLIRERDAHAWAEVFFPGYGWQSFDPTPPADDDTLARLWKGGVSLLLRHTLSAIRFPVLLMLAVIGLTVHLGRLGLYDPWRRRRALLRSAGDGHRGQVLRAYYLMCERLGRLEPRGPSQTVAEYSRAVAEKAKGAAWMEDVDALTRAFVAARFGPGPTAEAEAQAARQHLARVLAGLK